MKKLLLPILFGTLVACGDKDDDTATDTDTDTTTDSETDSTTDSETDSETDTTTDSETDTEVAWSDMDREQRRAFMEDEVTPAIAGIMQGHDSELYGGDGFQCSTCHGEAFWEAEVDYVMPNPANAGKTAIGDGAPGVIDWASEEPAYVAYRDQLMFGVVTEMSTLLQVEPWSEDNPEGFGCASCHPSATR